MNRSGGPGLLDSRVPPPLVMLLCGALAWMARRAWPDLAVAVPWGEGLARLTGSAALALVLAAVITFRRAGTTVDPLHPERASALVRHGVFAFSRNPMYLAMALALLAWGLWLGHAVALAMPLAFAAWIDRFQIRPEERALQARFGDDFTAYRQAVRRWI